MCLASPALAGGFITTSAMTNLDSVLKNRDITLPTTVHLVKAMVFPEVMYGRLSAEELMLSN